MDFKLPDIGEGVHEGEVVRWLVKVGDHIQADQPMVEVMTDKATVEIPSPVTGVVSVLHAKEGQTIEVGKTLLTISENGKGAGKVEMATAAPKNEESATPKETARETQKTVEAARLGNAGAESHAAFSDDDVLPFNILATPATRKLARDLSIDLKGLKGSGPSGRITKVDVQMAYEGQQAATPRSSHPAPTSTALTTPSAKPPVVSRGALERIPLKGIRKRISESMAHSKRTAAHFTYVEEVDMTEVVKMRGQAKDEAARRNLKLSYLPFIIKALIPALKEFPFLNASLDDEKQEIIVKGDYNIGIAVDTPQGLMVPNIKGADAKSIWDLASEIGSLSEAARQGKSKLEDLKQGTFTITNAGTIGGVFATPVINHPEVAILGVNAIRKRPMVVDDQIVIRDMMFLSLSVDHRVVDGADAARFMNRLIYFLSEPTRLVFA